MRADVAIGQDVAASMISYGSISGESASGRPVTCRRGSGRTAARSLRPAAPFALPVVMLLGSMSPADAKTPGQTYCFHGVCHRVLSVEETQRAVGRTETVLASFYDHPSRDAGNPNAMTSSGERFDGAGDRTAASPVYPNGTRLLLWHAKTRAAAVVRVTNSGPYHGARRLDVSRGAAERLGFRPLGISQLSVTVLAAPTHEEARFVKGRTYLPAPGYLGVFQSFETARAAALHRIGTDGFAAVTKVASQTAPKPLHTGSVGWDTTVQAVRSPLQRPAASGQPPARPSTPAAMQAQAPSSVSAANGPVAPAIASRAPAGWGATLVEPPSATTSSFLQSWPGGLPVPHRQPGQMGRMGDTSQ